MRNERNAQTAYENALKTIKDMEEKDQIISKALVEVAKDEDCVYYGDIAPLIGVSPRSIEMNAVLERISRRKHGAGRPLLTAVVIKKTTGMPGNGFFNLARNLGLHDGNRDRKYWLKEIRRVHDHWRGR